MSEIISYWLTPAKKYHHYLQSLVAELANTYDAPSFEPHLVAYRETSNQFQSPADIILKAISGFPPLTLSISEIDHSEQFSKALFIRFATSGDLNALTEAIRESSDNPSDYILEPQLNLICAKLPLAVKKVLLHQISLPWQEIVFDSIKAVATPPHTRCAEDVACWEDLCAFSLRNPG